MDSDDEQLNSEEVFGKTADEIVAAEIKSLEAIGAGMKVDWPDPANLRLWWARQRTMRLNQISLELDNILFVCRPASCVK